MAHFVYPVLCCWQLDCFPPWLLRIMLLWTWVYKYPFNNLFLKISLQLPLQRQLSIPTQNMNENKQRQVKYIFFHVTCTKEISRLHQATLPFRYEKNASWFESRNKKNLKTLLRNAEGWNRMKRINIYVLTRKLTTWFLQRNSIIVFHHTYFPEEIKVHFPHCMILEENVCTVFNGGIFGGRSKWAKKMTQSLEIVKLIRRG